MTTNIVNLKIYFDNKESLFLSNVKLDYYVQTTYIHIG